ncbi:hypothetical protein SUDANB178_07499 [Streptomyces sp. enrichment culture]
MLLAKTVRISAPRKPPFDHEGRPLQAGGYGEHAAVTATAAVLAGVGYGMPLSLQTEVAHRLPYGSTPGTPT